MNLDDFVLPRAVHGGAIATMFDSISGVLTYQLGYRCVTANLNVNFHGYVFTQCNLYLYQYSKNRHKNNVTVSAKEIRFWHDTIHFE